MSQDPEDKASAEEFRQGPQEMFKVYYWLWKELLNDEGRTTAKRLAVSLCAKNMLAMLTPWCLGKLVEALALRQMSQVWKMFALIALVSGGAWIFQRFESRLREIIFGANMGSINLRVNELFLAKSLGQHLRESTVLSSSGMEKGRNRALESANLFMTEAAEAFFLLSISYLALWCVSIRAGVVTTFVFGGCLVWAYFLNNEVAKVCVPLDVIFRRWHRHLSECWDHVERVKTSGKEQAEVDQLTTDWEGALAQDRRFWLWFLSHTSYRYLLSTVALFLVLYGAIREAEHSLAAVGLIFPLFIWMRAILDNIWRLGNVEHKLSWFLPAILSMKEALTLPTDIVVPDGAPSVDASQGVEIVFERVTHAYHPSTMSSSSSVPARITRPVLKGVSFTIGRGERVALIGPSGAGKTSIMRLIQRAYDPESGRILVNGVDLSELDLGSFLQHIGYIPQRSNAIFEGTLGMNLRYALAPEQAAETTDEFLWSLIERLKVADRMEKGLETLLGKGGIELSGGEAQRVMVAAALAKRPKFFLIDEATSALDSTTERAVQAVFDEALTGDVGALIIAHRLSTVRHVCTKFVVLRPASDGDEPQVEAIASSFEELYRCSPTFRQLADDQGIAIAGPEAHVRHDFLVSRQA